MDDPEERGARPPQSDAQSSRTGVDDPMDGEQRHERPDGETTMPRGKVHADMTTAHLLDDGPSVEPGEAAPLDAVRAHRSDVVRRLLDRGLSPATLEQILPGWSELADE